MPSFVPCRDPPIVAQSLSGSLSAASENINKRPINIQRERRMNTTYRASDGAAYERFLGRWTRALAGPLADFARVPEDGLVLDVGCGTGSLALALAERRRDRVAGIDIA